MVPVSESFLHYVWQHQLLEGLLYTADGLSVEVERPGMPNRDAGPDFFDSRVRIGGTLWAGNVEVHVRASDWALHRHGGDRAYDNVVLHVVYEDDAPVVRPDGCPFPTLVVADHIPQAVWDNYEALMAPPDPIGIPCQERIRALPHFFVASVLDRLVLERLEAKCEAVGRFLSDSRGDWEQCCYWMLAHYFGGKANGFAFELLARSTAPGLLARWRDRPQRVEAVLMGQAGLLEGRFEDDYPRRMQADYAAVRQAAGLTPIAGHLWKFFRLRPHGFPTIRISQFAQLVCRSRNLFSQLLETPDAAGLKRLFDVAASDYWTDHYRFDVPSPGSPKRLSPAFVELLLMNAWVPLLFEYGRQHAAQQYKDRAVAILEQLQPENNHIVRRWRAAGIVPENAAQSQALLQLHGGYCQGHDCLRCRIGYKIIVP